MAKLFLLAAEEMSDKGTEVATTLPDSALSSLRNSATQLDANRHICVTCSIKKGWRISSLRHKSVGCGRGGNRLDPANPPTTPRDGGMPLAGQRAARESAPLARTHGRVVG